MHKIFLSTKHLYQNSTRPRKHLRNILIPVCPLPVVSLLCGRLDEEGVGGEWVKVDQRGLLSPDAVVD